MGRRPVRGLPSALGHHPAARQRLQKTTALADTNQAMPSLLPPAAPPLPGPATGLDLGVFLLAALLAAALAAGLAGVLQLALPTLHATDRRPSRGWWWASALSLGSGLAALAALQPAAHGQALPLGTAVAAWVLAVVATGAWLAWLRHRLPASAEFQHPPLASAGVLALVWALCQALNPGPAPAWALAAAAGLLCAGLALAWWLGPPRDATDDPAEAAATPPPSVRSQLSSSLLSSQQAGPSSLSAAGPGRTPPVLPPGARVATVRIAKTGAASVVSVVQASTQAPHQPSGQQAEDSAAPTSASATRAEPAAASVRRPLMLWGLSWPALAAAALGQVLAMGLLAWAAPGSPRTATPFAGPLPAASLLLMGVASLLLPALLAWAAGLDQRGQRRQQALRQSLHNANRRLHAQAVSDPLTQLPNRGWFEEHLGQALVKLDRRPGSLAVFFLDMDGFKPVNDAYGHAAGDAVLRTLGKRLRGLARGGSRVARVGGDEFVLLLESPGGASGAAAMAQRLLALVSEPVVLPNTVQVKLSCSIGIALYPEQAPRQGLVACADTAMYAAKRAGGSTFVFYEPGMAQDGQQQLALQQELRAALDHQELALYYQPKVDASTGQITGAEALLRWNHPTRGLVLPGQFLPVAERFGLMPALSRWVMGEACSQLQRWRAQGLRMRLAINVSAQQLQQDTLQAQVRQAVEQHGIDPAQLTLEIHEAALMDDAAVAAFGALAATGVKLSIDDFGLGHCNFAMLRRLPLQQLKLDRCLFADLASNPDSHAVVDAVLRMARALGLKVVAEGVETEAQRRALLALGCSEMQGYLFAKPMSAVKLGLWAMDDGPQQHRDLFRPSLFEE